MAQYTIELRDVIRQGHKIFDFPYDFYDEGKKGEFEEKFIRHFYFREIGVPDVERFKHFLEDKMLTVFPYYNQLMKTNQVEYSILDNYNITETTTIERANEGKSASVSSTRGETSDTQLSENRDTRFTDTHGDTFLDEKKTQQVDEDVTTEKDGVSSSYGTTDETKNKTKSEDKESIRKFLDTPQGAVNLEDSSYLTNLNHDTEDNSVREDDNSNVNTTNSGVMNENTSNQTDRSVEENNESSQKSTGSESTVGESFSNITGKQTGLTDNNTRAYTDSKQSETMEVKRKGNIGVDTDADMIQKHIKLQQILSKIEHMFFDECEDLFMLVY